jgi:hypothetical protein
VARRVEAWLINAIALHSLAVGLALLFLGRWGLALGGWSDVSPLFFARQAGVFHVVVAVGYFLEYRRYGSVYLIILAKTIAVLFLVATVWLDGAPWSVSASAVGDGLMGLAALVVHRQRRHYDE